MTGLEFLRGMREGNVLAAPVAVLVGLSIGGSPPER
jgi:hypothetical protein